MTSTTNSVKQRKLADLRVIDLQRELRTFNVAYDKKELKVSLLEKLRQALLNRNIDPNNYLFDTAMDLKSGSTDENNRSHEENGSYEAHSLDSSTPGIDSEQRLDIENPVQTDPTAMSMTNEIDDEQTTRMDIKDLGQVVEDREEDDDDNIFLTIDDHPTTKQEDENNNDTVDDGLGQVSRSLSDAELDPKSPTQQSSSDNHFFNHKKDSITTPHSAMEQQPSSDPNRGEDQPNTTSDLPSIDNDTKSKSELDRQDSSNDLQKQQTTNQSNTNPCLIWVSNIAKRTHASDLKTLFSKYGKVLTTKVIGSDSSQWFGYINLASPDDVEKCINALHHTELHGKKLYVDREMHEEPIRSSSSTSRSNNSSTPSARHPPSRESSSNTNNRRSDQSNYKSSTTDPQKKRDSYTNSQDKSLTGNTDQSSKKRSASTNSENKKKLFTSDANQSTYDEKAVKSHEIDSPTRISSNSNNDKSSITSTGVNTQSSKHHVSRADAMKSSEKSESSHRSITNERKNDPHSTKIDKSSSAYSSDVSKSRMSPPRSRRSHSNEKRSTSSSIKSDSHRSSSTDKSKQRPPSQSTANKYDKSKDTYRTKQPNTFENDRRSVYQNEQRIRHEKEMLVHEQLAQQQEEEKIKEEQRRLAEERERMRREFKNLERERVEIERTRSALEKEKQEQVRELARQQRRLAEEAKYRQEQTDAKLRDEKLQRIAQGDNKRPRSSHHESQRSYHSNINNTTSNLSSTSSSSNKIYDNRSSTNTPSGRERDRSLGDTNRDYYPEPKRQYTSNANNSREAAFRDRVAYRDSDLPTSTAGLGLSLSPSSSSMTSNNTNQRYLPPSSTQHRLSDPYNVLPQRGRDMALPPTSSVSTPYERPSRNTLSSPTNNSGALLRRPHSRERYNEREYMQQTQRRDRSPPINSALRREMMETTHWERPKPRESTHYPEDTHKYLPNSYPSESSQTNQQQGLWSAAPPSRQQQQHHHPDLSLKATSHGPAVDPYGWAHASQQVPSQPPSSHDRSRANINSNQRISILAPNQPPPPPSSSRGSITSQSHLYSHPGVPGSALSTAQQHATLAPPPPSLHHPTAYVTQQAPPPGLVLHPTGQTRAYEPHYVVTQSLPQRRY